MRLTICDATTAMYEGGPGFKPEHSWKYNALLVSQDPVALDYTGWQIIERKRAEKGLKTLEAEQRAPHYISPPPIAQHRLGTSDPSRIETVDDLAAPTIGRCIMSCRTRCKARPHPTAPAAGHCVPRSIAARFCMCALASGAALGAGEFAAPATASPSALSSSSPQKQNDSQFIVEAKFYEKLPNKKIKCKLCPRECTVGDRERGYCGVRENRGGTYYTLVHSRVCALPTSIPSRRSLCSTTCPGRLPSRIATAGCNVNCKFCQNWDISQSRPEQVPADYAPPQRIAELAKQNNCPTIAYTYSEPVVFSEFLMDTADAGHAAGIRSIVVSNGYMQEEALKTGYGKMDAVKIDLKAFTRFLLSKSRHRRVEAGARHARHICARWASGPRSSISSSPR